VTWRWWAGFAALGSAAVLGRQGDRAAAAVAGVCVLLIFAAWVRRELLATRARLRAAPEMAARVNAAAAASRAARVRGHAAPYSGDPGGGSSLPW
jgi:hypothetical protein